MRKMAAILISVMCLAGCDVAAQSGLASHDFHRIREVCIDGVIYLVYSGHKEGGITPKINAEHFPYTCPKLKQ